MNKTTNENIEARTRAAWKVSDLLEGHATALDHVGDCDDPAEFDETLGDVIAGLEKALTAAKAIRCARPPSPGPTAAEITRLRITPRDKAKLQRLAKRSRMSLSAYLIHRGLHAPYEPERRTD